MQVPSTFCSDKPPLLRKVCNKRPCRTGVNGNHHSVILPAANSVYVQKEPLRRVSIKVGGKAIVLEHTTLKIRCPRKLANKTFKVDWFKDSKKITYNKKFQLTARQALRVKKVTARDSGRYTCAIGDDEASILISVKPAAGNAPPPRPSTLIDDKSPTAASDSSSHANGWIDSDSTDQGNGIDAKNNKNNRATFLSTERSRLDLEDTHTASSVGGEPSSRVQPAESGARSGASWDAGQMIRSKGTFFSDQRNLFSGEWSSSAAGDLNAPSSSMPPDTLSSSASTSTGATPVVIPIVKFVEHARSSAAQNQTPMSQLQKWFLSKLSSSLHSSTLSALDVTEDIVTDSYNSMLDNVESDDRDETDDNELSYHPEPPMALVSDNEIEKRVVKSTMLGKGSADGLNFDWVSSWWKPAGRVAGDMN